jgi:hypothetical protein
MGLLINRWDDQQAGMTDNRRLIHDAVHESHRISVYDWPRDLEELVFLEEISDGKTLWDVCRLRSCKSSGDDV